MSVKAIKKIHLFYYPDNKRAFLWARKINRWLNKKHPHIKIGNGLSSQTEKPNAILALGGDGTILDAAKKYQDSGAIIVGLNLGTFGFLASVREPKNFLKFLDKFLNGTFKTTKRMPVLAEVWRDNKKIFSTTALNEVVIQSPIGMVELEVKIEDHPLQFIRGTGVLIATPTGSTAYNLSLHGPIVMPDIKCFIITEISDHNIPTPSIVVKRNRIITVKVMDFRKEGSLSITKTGQKIDLVMVVDGDAILPLEKNDQIVIKRSSKLIKFAEFDSHYFLKSIQEKFSFR